MDDDDEPDAGPRRVCPLLRRPDLTLVVLGRASCRRSTVRWFRERFRSVWRSLPAGSRRVLARHWRRHEAAVLLADGVPRVPDRLLRMDAAGAWCWAAGSPEGNGNVCFNGYLLPRLPAAVAEWVIAEQLALALLLSLGVDGDGILDDADALAERWGFPVRRLAGELARWA